MRQSKFASYFVLASFTLLIFSATQSNAQSLDLSFEFQVYPTGIIPGLRVEKGFADKNAVHLRVGYNGFDHRDLGVHNEEIGNGLGFTVGYKRYLKSGYKGWSLGVKNDLWFNTVNWKDNPGTADEVSGETKITVVQPTAELAYLMEFGGSWHFTPSIAFGYEINVQTEGEPTGEGAILLVGIAVGKRF